MALVSRPPLRQRLLPPASKPFEFAIPTAMLSPITYVVACAGTLATAKNAAKLIP